MQSTGFAHAALRRYQKPELLAAQSNQILTAVVQGARKEEPSPEVQLAAVTALLNSLEFIRANFEREVSCPWRSATLLCSSRLPLACCTCL